MGPLRILILVVLLYIAYRLIMKSLGKGGGSSPADDESGKPTGPPEQITDVLIEDPVCHKLVPKQQALQVEVGEETHYFCSKECSEIFLSEKGDEQ